MQGNNNNQNIGRGGRSQKPRQRSPQQGQPRQQRPQQRQSPRPKQSRQMTDADIERIQREAYERIQHDGDGWTEAPQNPNAKKREIKKKRHPVVRFFRGLLFSLLGVVGFVLLIAFIIALIPEDSGSSASRSTAANTPSQTISTTLTEQAVETTQPEPEEPPPLGTEERLRYEIIKAIDPNGYRSEDGEVVYPFQFDVSGADIVIPYAAADGFTEGQIQRRMVGDMIDIFRALRVSEYEYDMVALLPMWFLVDDFGNPKYQPVISAFFTRENIEKINYEFFFPENVPRISAQFYIVPEMDWKHPDWLRYP